MYYRLILLSLIGIVLFQHAVNADELDNFIHKTQSFQADFEQTISDQYGSAIESSRGKLILSRPEKFILDYVFPDIQKYISNGKTLWIYDAELEQVTIKAVDKTLLASSAFLLTNQQNYKTHYDIKKSLDSQNPERIAYLLTPKADQQTERLFNRLRFIFNQNTLAEIIMEDSFSQTTRLKLSNQTINPLVSDALFNFVVPDHIDVIGTVN